MNELSLFTGAGGGVLGTKLLGFKHIGYVEWDDYCQRLIAQRIKDGILDEAPIFGDIRSFISQGFAASYTGMVDVLSAGFPCQPFSFAGKRKGEADERNMWPSTIKCIRIIRPRYCLLENVPGLLVHPYFGTILGDLAKSGYQFRWTCLGADDVGGNHRRKRLWIVAYANEVWELQPKGSEQTQRGRFDNSVKKDSASDSYAEGMARSLSGECSGEAVGKNGEGQTWGRTLSDALLDYAKHGPTTRRSGCDVEPPLRRTNDGLANVVDRLKAIGNGQVPAVVRAVWKLLMQHKNISCNVMQ